MSGRAIGGYVRRSERRYVPPAPDDGISRCGYCRARLDLGMHPHLCKELTFGTSLPSLRFEDFEIPEAAGGFPASVLGTPAEPGPPYVHTFALPQPCPTDCDDDCELNPDGCHERHEVTQARDHDPGECEASRKPSPAWTLTEQP